MRIPRDQMFMDIAHVVAKRSTCCRLNVGAVITINNRIVSIGYNGAPSGASHCAGNDCVGRTPGLCPTIHAEQNAIEYMPAEYKRAHNDATLYVTEAPCLACAGTINACLWIKRVVFSRPYRLRDGVDHLIKGGVNVEQVTSAGYIIDQATGLVRDCT
ncbi:MAG: cytidine deaminase [Hyphomicrobiaceae bacterium]|nr:MAG: cytidine deaminase [Hyphomicrobiaceae bacterium]